MKKPGAKRKEKLVIQRVMAEENQSHETRRSIYAQLESELKRPVVSLFTSFRFPVMLEDTDANMLEGILQKMDLSKGLALVISSPGGSGLAAERIINVCRTYSGTGEYWAIVPGKAKSAATIVCFGASKIIMAGTSELGTIDPQVTYVTGDTVQRFSVYNIVKSYEDLFSRAVSEKGNLQPYLQQLQNYDEREIKEFRSALSLSGDMAVKALKSGMMSDKSEKKIKEKMIGFLTPKKVKVHGRPIYAEESSNCGLNIELRDVKEMFWQILYELYIRLDNFVSTKVAKCIESEKHSFFATLRRKDEEK